jgi:hypothetical protein
MRKTLLFVTLMIAHAGASVALYLLVFGLGMARFDTGTPPSFMEGALGLLATILHSPLLTLFGDRIPEAWWAVCRGYLPFLLNSLIWVLGGLAVAWRRP